MCCQSITFHLMRSLPDALRRRSLGSRSVQPWRLGSSTHLGQKSYFNAFQRRFKNGYRIFQKSSLTLIELEIAELAQKALHHAVDVLLESVHLSCSVVVLQILHNLLHVVLEVGHVVVLLGKTSLNQPKVDKMLRSILQGGRISPVVENQVDTGLGGLLGALLHLLGGGVAALELHVAERSHLVLGEKLGPIPVIKLGCFHHED